MAEFVIMPKTGVTVTECALGSWYKHEGDPVQEGEPLFSYETDKTSVDENSPVSGTVLKLLYQEGDIVPCLEPVCVIGQAGEKVEDAKAEETASAESAAEEKEEAPKDISDGVPVVSGNRPYSASPRARACAKRMGVDLEGIKPTGPENRIICRDVEQAAANRPAAAAPSQVEKPKETPAAAVSDYTDVKLGSVRKIIAKRMGESLRDIPQLTLTSSFDSASIKRLRSEFKTCTCNPDLNGISINDMLIFALSRVLPHHSALNANYLEGDVLREFTGVHIGIAVDTERGLLVPVLRDAQNYSLIGLSKAVHKLIDDTRSGNVTPDMLNGASFTISNLGSMKIEHFTPVINGPQTGILGVGCPEYRRKPDSNGEMKDYEAIGLCLTFDHRALDGAPASRFMVELINYLEQFHLMQYQA